jgi:hypothetical protein
MRVRLLIALLLAAASLAPGAGANAPIRQTITISDFRDAGQLREATAGVCAALA